MEPPPVQRKEQSEASTSLVSENGGSIAPDFQSPSTVIRTTHAPSLSSNRNAAGGQPPIQVSGGNGGPREQLKEVQPVAPVKPVNRPASGKNAIVYNTVQRRNPILQQIRNVGLELGDIPADYQVGAHAGVLFLSLRYHRLHPEYIHGRIEKMRNAYNMRILLILCDINEHQQSLRELSKVAVINDLTIFVAWSNEEAAQYLSTFKQYEFKSADSLKEKVHQDYHSQLDSVLTSASKIRKPDVEALAAQFGSFANIVQQGSHALGSVKGLGPTRVRILYDAFNQPFIAGGRKTKAAPPSINAATVHAGESSVPKSSSTNALPAPPPTISETSGNGNVSHTPHEEQLSLPGIAGSPDWPSDASGNSTPPTPRRPVDTGPSRSPSVGADPERTATGEVWADPLADDDDDEEEAEDDDENERPAKRARVDKV